MIRKITYKLKPLTCVLPLPIICSNYLNRYNLDFGNIPDVPTEKFYMMISRKFKYADELKSLIDNEVSEVKGGGILKLLESESVTEIKSLFSYSPYQH